MIRLGVWPPLCVEIDLVLPSYERGYVVVVVKPFVAHAYTRKCITFLVRSSICEQIKENITYLHIYTLVSI